MDKDEDLAEALMAGDGGRRGAGDPVDAAAASSGERRRRRSLKRTRSLSHSQSFRFVHIFSQQRPYFG